MFRTALRNLLSHKLRLALSGMAIVLGVAFVAGTMIFTDTLEKTFRDVIDSGSADVDVSARSAFDSGLVGTSTSSARSSVPASVVEEIRAVDGVAAAEGYVQTEGVYVLDSDGEVLETNGAPGLGVSWTEDATLAQSEITEGRAPEAADEVVLDEGSADKLGYEVGDRVTVLTPGPRVEATLVGVLKYGESGNLAGATLASFETVTAQELLLEPGRFSGVAVAASEDTTEAELDRALTAALGDDYEVRTRTEQSDAASASLEESIGFINTFLMVFAGVALFVGTFIILNTFSMLVAQRTRELALLRALGASRRQVTRAVLLEAAILAVVGSTAGLLLGYGLAQALRALMGQFGLELTDDLVFTTGTAAWSYAVGLLVTLLAAYLPARRAARVAPVAAMRTDLSPAAGSMRRRHLLGTAAGTLGALALVGGLVMDESAELVALGSGLLMGAAIALSPVLAGPFVRATGALLPRLAGTAGRLARENALRNPRRTAATASALMIGLALVSGFSILGASANASVEELVEDTITADFVVSTSVGQPFTADVARQLEEVDGVAGVLQERQGAARFGDLTSSFSAYEADELGEALRLRLREGELDGLAGSGLLVDESTARQEGWAVGDSVPFLVANGESTQLTVGGIFEDNDGIGSLLVSMDIYDATGGVPLDRYLYVDLADGVDAGAVRPALERVLDAYPVVDLKDSEEFIDQQKGQVQQMLTLINALLVLSVLIAVLGVVNTLALSVIERTRELGLLRAVGMSRRQLRRMVRLESVVIAVYGAALGLVLGGIFGISLVQALAGEGIDVLSVPVGQLLALLVLGAVIGVVAATFPARRAARLQILDAIATS